MSTVAPEAEASGLSVCPRSRAAPSAAPSATSASSGRKSQEMELEDPQLQPQPQLGLELELQLCRHQNQRQHLEIPGLNSLTTTSTTTTDTSPSSWSPSYPTASSLIREHSIELVQRPETAYFSPYRARPSPYFLSTPSSITLNECCTPAKSNTTTTRKTMGLSKSQRIAILLAIDSVFFLIELIIGYAVHSLALVADSFHMLNDVLSLCVGLWAVRVANTGSSKMYTYGWQRAETLGALVNGVFLVALCLSIFLEAIQRFVEPQVVSNPKLVLIVGCLGLASNILGLFLFHDHGHSHGGDGGDHGDGIKSAEEGHSHSHVHADGDTHAVADENGNIEDVLPQVRVAGFNGSSGKRFSRSDEENTTTSAPSPNTSHRRSVISNSEVHGRHRRRASGSFGRGFGSVDNIHIHPASFRQDIIQAARVEEESESDQEGEALLDDNDLPNERSKILPDGHSSPTQFSGYGSIGKKRASTHYDHDEHNHNQSKDSHDGHGHGGHGGHGHSHGDLNMRGVFLHVMGDALGNIGVIGSALIIWLTTFPGRYYCDPAISLVITVIILCSAIPLCKAASRILLQAVPVGMSIDEITADIESLPRVIEAHHLHVWQLNDTKLVASLHVKVNCEVEGSGSASYMHLAREIRSCLHGYGIHSSTIQPEFCSPDGPDSPSGSTAVANGTINGDASPKTAVNGSKAGSLRSEGRTCLLECGDNCADSSQCCPTDVKPPKK